VNGAQERSDNAAAGLQRKAPEREEEERREGNRRGKEKQKGAGGCAGRNASHVHAFAHPKTPDSCHVAFGCRLRLQLEHLNFKLFKFY
jgi:hypothetical protein